MMKETIKLISATIMLVITLPALIIGLGEIFNENGWIQAVFILAACYYFVVVFINPRLSKD